MKISVNGAYQNLDLQNGASYEDQNGVRVSRDESGRVKLDGTTGNDIVSGMKEGNGYLVTVETEGGPATAMKLTAEEARGLQVDLGQGDDEYWFDASYDAAGEIQDLQGDNKVTRAPENISGEVSSEMASMSGSFYSAPNVAPKKPSAESREFARARALNDAGSAALAHRLQEMLPTEAPPRPEGLGPLESQAWDAMEKGPLLTSFSGFGGGPATTTFLHDPSGALDHEALAERGKESPFEGQEPYAFHVQPNYLDRSGGAFPESQHIKIKGPNGTFTVRRGDANFDAFSKLLQHAKKQKPLVDVLS